MKDILDSLYDRIDDLLIEGEFRQVDDELLGINISETSSVILLGYLTITLYASQSLQYRKEFFEKVKDKLKTQKSTQYNYEDLLRGLE